MSDFNPNSTNTKGLEWHPHTTRDTVLDASGKALVHVFTAGATENATSIIAYVTGVSGVVNPEDGCVVCEVVPLASLYASGHGSSTFFPNEDVTDGGMTGVPTDTVGNLHDNIDEAAGFPVPGSVIHGEAGAGWDWCNWMLPSQLILYKRDKFFYNNLSNDSVALNQGLWSYYGGGGMDLRESEAKYKTVVELALDALLMIDSDTGIVLEANRRAERLFVFRPSRS